MDAGPRNYRYSSKLCRWKYGSCQHSVDCGKSGGSLLVTTMTPEEMKRFQIILVFMKLLFLYSEDNAGEGSLAPMVPAAIADTVMISLAKEHR